MARERKRIDAMNFDDDTLPSFQLYQGAQTEMIKANIDARAASGYERESEPYRQIMSGYPLDTCQPSATAPWHKLGAVALITLGLLFGTAVGMALGAASKDCSAVTK